MLNPFFTQRVKRITDSIPKYFLIFQYATNGLVYSHGNGSNILKYESINQILKYFINF